MFPVAALMVSVNSFMSGTFVRSLLFVYFKGIVLYNILLLLPLECKWNQGRGEIYDTLYLVSVVIKFIQIFQMPAMFNAFSGIRYHQMHKYITVKFDNKICNEDLLHRKTLCAWNAVILTGNILSVIKCITCLLSNFTV